MLYYSYNEKVIYIYIHTVNVSVRKSLEKFSVKAHISITGKFLSSPRIKMQEFMWLTLVSCVFACTVINNKFNVTIIIHAFHNTHTAVLSNNTNNNNNNNKHTITTQHITFTKDNTILLL